MLLPHLFTAEFLFAVRKICSASPENKNMKNEFNIEEIDKIVSEKWTGRESLVSVLHAIRARYGWLPEPALRRICEITGVTPETVSSVVSFYPVFRTRPAGKHFIHVCIGTACHVKGAEKVFEYTRE